MGIEEVWQDYKKLIIYYLDVIKNGREQKKKTNTRYLLFKNKHAKSNE